MDSWRKGLQPGEWEQLFRGEMTPEQLQAAHRRATARRPQLVIIENSTDESSNGHAA
jgi:hypothetical protein